MALESISHIADLVTTNPTASDPKSQGDDHIRGIKTALKTDFPNITAPVTATHTELNYVAGVTSAVQTQLNALAPIASPTFTGTPAAPTATAGTNTTQVATTAFVKTAVANANLAAAGTWVLLNETTVSSSVAAVDFVHGTGGVVLDSTYDEYEIVLRSVIGQYSSYGICIRTSTNAGSSFDSGSADYDIQRSVLYSGTDGHGYGTANSLYVIEAGAGSAGQDGVSGNIRFSAPSVAKYFMCRGELSCIDNSSYLRFVTFSGIRVANADVDAIRIFSSNGNLEGGKIRLYGRRLT